MRRPRSRRISRNISTTPWKAIMLRRGNIRRPSWCSPFRSSDRTRRQATESMISRICLYRAGDIFGRTSGSSSAVIVGILADWSGRRFAPPSRPDDCSLSSLFRGVIWRLDRHAQGENGDSHGRHCPERIQTYMPSIEIGPSTEARHACASSSLEYVNSAPICIRLFSDGRQEGIHRPVRPYRERGASASPSGSRKRLAFSYARIDAPQAPYEWGRRFSR